MLTEMGFDDDEAPEKVIDDLTVPEAWTWQVSTFCVRVDNFNIFLTCTNRFSLA